MFVSARLPVGEGVGGGGGDGAPNHRTAKKPGILHFIVTCVESCGGLYETNIVPNALRGSYYYTVKKVSGFLVPSRDATYQTLPGL
jgi:hypothetical protein